MSDKIERYLAGLADQLTTAPRYLFQLTDPWIEQFPDTAGVLLLFKEGEPCYCTESANLRGTVKDILREEHHPVRRLVQQQISSSSIAHEARARYGSTPTEVDWQLEDNYEIAVLPVAIGRKELEECMIQVLGCATRPNQPEVLSPTERLRYIKAKHKNAYQPWTTEEEDRMMDLLRGGTPIGEVARLLDRQPGAIRSRRKKVEERAVC